MNFYKSVESYTGL